MISTFGKKIRQMLFAYDWAVVEIMGSMFKIAWGFWLLLPFPTFRLISGYTAVGKENYWGICLLIYGICHFASIMSGNRRWRRYFTFGGFLFWLFTIILVWQQSHTSSLLPFFFLITFFMGLNFIRLGIPVQTISDQRVGQSGPNYGQRKSDYPGREILP